MNPIYLELDIEDAIDLAELFHSTEKLFCIGCVEHRIGRRLVPADFGADVPFNMYGVGAKSERLMDRLGIEGLKFIEDIV